MMEMKNKSKMFTVLWAALAGLLLLSACSGPVERQFVKNPGWSRAVLTGTTYVNEPAPVVLDDQGHLYFLLFVDAGENQVVPRVRAFSRSGEFAMLWQQDLNEVPLQRPTRAQLLYDGSQLHLFWVDQYHLYTAVMDLEGELVSAPRLISGETTVERFAAAILPSGETSVWYAGSRREPGLWVLSSTGAESGPVAVDPAGNWPSLFVDAQGTLHVTWAQVPNGYGTMRMFYAGYPGGTFTQDREILVYEQSFNPSTILEGPWVGVSGDHTTMIWTEQIKTGMEAGTVRTSYASFPNGQVTAIEKPAAINTPDESRLTYSEVPEAVIASGPRFSLANQASYTNALTEIAINPRPAGELAVALHSSVEYEWRQVKGQVSVAYLRDGQPADYQLVSFSQAGAASPALTSDQDQYLYLTWLEKGAEPGFRVYFTSTYPDIVAAQSRLDAQDYGRLAMETVFGMLIGAVLSPLFGALALAPTLLAMLLTSPLRRESDERRIDTGTVISLAICLVVYWVVKYLSLLGVGTYVPFSAWLPIPAALGPVLQIIIPLLILAVALRVAWHFTYGRDSKSTLYFLLIYVAVDAVLTLSIYGVLIYDAF